MSTSGWRIQVDFLVCFTVRNLDIFGIETLPQVKDLFKLILFLRDILLMFVSTWFGEHVFIVELFSFTNLICMEIHDT